MKKHTTNNLHYLRFCADVVHNCSGAQYCVAEVMQNTAQTTALNLSPCSHLQDVQLSEQLFVGLCTFAQRAVLCCAVLYYAVLCCAVLCCAVLCCAVLCCAVLCCAVLRGAVLLCCAYDVM